MHDDYKQLAHQHDLERCPMCNSTPGMWQYSPDEKTPTKKLVACTHSERIGPQDGLVNEGCLLYMPPEEFYRETAKDAARYWNEFARALIALRRSNE